MNPSGGAPPSARQISLDSLTEFDQILAGHFVVDAERHPAHGPVRLPLQLAAPAGDRRRDALAGVFIGNGSRRGIVRDDRHLQDDPGLFVDRQKRRIGLRALFAQRRQHDLHHFFEMPQDVQKRLVKASRRVTGGRGQELVVEAELVEEGAQPRIVVRGETRMRAERIGHLGERLAEMLRHHFFVGHIVGNLAQPIHVVGERNQPGFDLIIGKYAKCVTHHRCARDFAERADMRQPGWSIAGLEYHLDLGLALEPRDDLARFLERPSVRKPCDFAQRGSGDFSIRHQILLSSQVMRALAACPRGKCLKTD